MAAPSFYLTVVLISCWLTASTGFTSADDDSDSDDMWPVLCPPETFYSKKQDQCLPCSQCPVNKIITSVCHGLHDTKCEPFDFKNFIQSNEATFTNKDKLEAKTNSAGGDKKSFKNINDLEDTVDHFNKTPKETVEFTDSHWRSLTICLVVFLILLCVAIFLIGIWLFRRRSTSEKKIVCEYSSPPEIV